MMKIAIALAAGVLLAAPAAAKPRSESRPVVGQEASIPFVDVQAIRSFHAEQDDVVYLQDHQRRWYRAELSGRCQGLPWANRVAVDTRGGSTFSRGDMLLVEDDRCIVSSLTHSDKPPRRASKRTRRAR